MKYPEMNVFPLALSFLHYSSCIELRLRLRRLTPTSSRFAQTFTTIEGLSLLECAVYGRNEDALGINHRAESREFELMKRTNDCIEYESGDMTGWQAFRSCSAVDSAGMSWFFGLNSSLLMTIHSIYTITVRRKRIRNQASMKLI